MKIFLAVPGWLILAGLAQAEGGKMTGVRQQVDVSAAQGKVIVTVRIDNGSARPVYVPKAVFEDDELFGRVFDIKDAAGKEVDYIGPMVKRGPYTKADYLAVKPGGKRSNSIDIARSYDFKAGAQTYTLSYSGAYLTDLAKLDAASTAAPKAVTFIHAGK